MFPILRIKFRRKYTFSFLRVISRQTKMSVLNVAEKNDAGKNIAALLSKGTAIRREGSSKMNKVYEFECEAFGQNCRMIMTSVSGHLKSLEFDNKYTNWQNTDPLALFEAPIRETILSEAVKKNLEAEVKVCSKLIIWTDCDREGENIGFQIMSTCKAVKKNLEVYRAKFSEINYESVRRALNNLGSPDEHISNAVEVRRELDLRIGAAFTRFQSLFLRKTFPNALKGVISYGSCQFPTLGFVVERFKTISEFKAEKFWQINVQHTKDELSVDFHWKRSRLFDKLACEVLYEKCSENGTAKVEKVESRPSIKKRPVPLDTTTFQKLASRKFKMSAKEALTIAENLYTKGLISYPRTETNFFSKEINLNQLVSFQTKDHRWGEFAQKVLRDGPNPSQGKKSDEAHSPIHPIRYSNTLSGKEKEVYEFIVRHFLACLSKNAEGLQTIIDIDVAEEKFSAKGLIITAKNYLEVYPYEQWNDKVIHTYCEGETFQPNLSMVEGETSPPSLLTEADLIGLMEKHGIGTDSTQADHIETIKSRLYVGLQDGKYFVPRTLGMGLVEGYNCMGHCMVKPELRAELEEDLKRICNREKSPEEVLKNYIAKYKALYVDVQKKKHLLSEMIQSYIEVEPALDSAQNNFTPLPVGKCPSCHSDLHLRKKMTNEKYIGCSAYPQCKVVVWFPSFVLDVTKTQNFCPTCVPNISLLQFKFKKGSCPYPPFHIGCIGGCDEDLLNVLNIKALNRKVERPPAVAEFSRRDAVNDSGFVSLDDLSPPNCYCGTPAESFSVKKSGPNFGREFFKCRAIRNSSKCNFFQWKDNKEENRSLKKINTRGEDLKKSKGGHLHCYCSIPCKRITSKKEGPRKGEVFFTCGKPFTDPSKCNFFQWENVDKDGPKKNFRFERPNRKTRALASNVRSKKDDIWTVWRIGGLL